MKKSAGVARLLQVTPATRIRIQNLCILSPVRSARFRNRKKQKALNLERSVSDLAGRADELEKEATELRMENNWLKDIVILSQTSRTLSHPEGGAEEDNSESEGEHNKAVGESARKLKGRQHDAK